MAVGADQHRKGPGAVCLFESAIGILIHRQIDENLSVGKSTFGFQCLALDRSCGTSDDFLADRAALGCVTVQQCFLADPLQNQRHLPGKVVSILDAGVQALSASRRMDMRSIAGDENTADAVTLRQLR